MAKKEVKKVVVKAPKVPVAKPKKLAGSKAKEPKFRLVSYSMKAIIPTGMYSNLQPEIVVEAESLEQAERAVMPHIEALFTKYRSDSNVMPQAVRHEKAVEVKPAPVATPAQAQKAPESVPAQPTAQAKETPVKPVEPVQQSSAPVELSVPFQRAESAVKSCNSKEALKLVESQITKSVKLTQEEKNTLIMMVSDKAQTLNG